MPLKERKNKPQVRTAETLAKILDAAEATFSEQGFEMTQLEEIAARAGYTRGAIYAHFASKEDLFFALMEQRVLAKFADAQRVVAAEPEVGRRIEVFRHWISSQLEDRTWGILMLEFKLYARRRPQSFDKLRHLYDQMTYSSGHDFITLLMGDGIEKEMRVRMERRLSIFGAVLSAVVLESYFRPNLFPEQQLKEIFEDLTLDLMRG